MENAIHMLPAVGQGQTMRMIITTDDGKIIVIDGGYRKEAKSLISYLQELTGESCPHIDAWFLTHPHEDHIEAFMEIVEKYPDALTFDKVYYNFPSSQFHTKYRDASADVTTAEFYSLLPRFADKICICSVADVYDIGNAHVEILYSTDAYITHNVCNNTSLVFKITLGGKTILILGDCGIEAGHRILNFFGKEKVKSDICQMAHHGQNGCDRAFYEAVNPEVCLWCTPEWLWNNDAGKGYNTHCWQTIVVRGWMEELGVKQNLVSKDGIQVYRW